MDNIEISQCALLNMTVKVITALEGVYAYKILNSYAIAFKTKFFTKIFSDTFESIQGMSMSFHFQSIFSVNKF